MMGPHNTESLIVDHGGCLVWECQVLWPLYCLSFYLQCLITSILWQGRIHVFKLGGAHIKKFVPNGGRRENFGGISCEKSRFYAKKIIFFQILGGGARAGCTPLESAPVWYLQPFLIITLSVVS